MSRPAVLVVEDEPHICELIADILQPEGFEAVCVNTDTEAFESLRAGGPFACLVVDVNLRQGQTGFDVARFARGLTPDLPIVFTSGEASHSSFDAHGVPGALFVAKPFSAQDMIDKINVLVGDGEPES
jgi:CheY-like chemotaxis protein